MLGTGVGAKDLAYSTVLALVREGKNNKVKGEYGQVAKELSTDRPFLLRGSRLVIPYGDRGELRLRILKQHTKDTWASAGLKQDGEAWCTGQASQKTRMKKQ